MIPTYSGVMDATDTAYPSRRTNASSMFGRRQRRRPNIEPAFGRRLLVVMVSPFWCMCLWLTMSLGRVSKLAFCTPPPFPRKYFFYFYPLHAHEVGEENIVITMSGRPAVPPCFLYGRYPDCFHIAYTYPLGVITFDLICYLRFWLTFIIACNWWQMISLVSGRYIGTRSLDCFHIAHTHLSRV